MPRPPRRPAPQRDWEQQLIDAYSDARWRAALDPLYEEFRRWKAGELTHDDLDRAIHRTHRQGQQIDAFFTQRRAELVALIQWDRDFFEPCVAAHPPPSGVGLIPPPPAPGDDALKEEGPTP
jgi:hypothetical protein